MDDTWLKDDNFVDNLESMLEDKLFDHDQKKVIQRVDTHKEPEQKLTELKADVKKFY